jgi:hypothetical protein
VFAFFDKGNLIILINGFQKKTQKTPKKEIELAEKLKKHYFDENRKKLSSLHFQITWIAKTALLGAWDESVMNRNLRPSNLGSCFRNFEKRKGLHKSNWQRNVALRKTTSHELRTMPVTSDYPP